MGLESLLFPYLGHTLGKEKGASLEDPDQAIDLLSYHEEAIGNLYVVHRNFSTSGSRPDVGCEPS